MTESHHKSTGRWQIGIDLGTSHCALAWADPASRQPQAKIFAVSQMVAAGQQAARPLLPSVGYQPLAAERPTLGVMAGPLLGRYAAELGSKSPGRLISSAKSWLSHSQVDAQAAILPWGANTGSSDSNVEQLSPVAMSAALLQHLHEQWNQAHPQQPLAEQDIVLTVPASFDERARALTLAAVEQAGLSVKLLEEPLAACYSWLHQHTDWQAQLADTRTILVCDVGGGTTDFTLLTHKDGQLERVAVGRHLLLGGDNMDLALAHLAESNLSGKGQLSAGQWSSLVAQCQVAKEKLLAADGPEQVSINIASQGSGLLGGSRKAVLQRTQVLPLLLDGFMPLVSADSVAEQHAAALRQFGLPYETDAAISRHLAEFLAEHQAQLQAAHGQTDGHADANEQATIWPDALLLNGGVFHADQLRQRLVEQLQQWAGTTTRQAAKVLNHAEHDQAVALGAVSFGLSRNTEPQGEAAQLKRTPHIKAGAARNYYLLLDDEQAICLLPQGTETETTVALQQHPFSLQTGKPVQIQLASTAVQAPAAVGSFGVAADLQALPPMVAVLGEQGELRRQQVYLSAKLSDIGTLEVVCTAADQDERWQLQFELRGQTNTAVASDTNQVGLHEAMAALETVYGPAQKSVQQDAGAAAKQLRKTLEKTLGPRKGWDINTLRCLYDSLWQLRRRRRRSADHERVWFALAGYCLRPGFGDALDQWRTRQLTELHQQGLQYGKANQVQAEWLTFWRRCAPGLGAELQQLLWQQNKGPLLNGQGQDEQWRLAACLELIDAQQRQALAKPLLKLMQKNKASAVQWWVLGRLGARVPLGPNTHTVLAAEIIQPWLEQALQADWRKAREAASAAVVMARLTGDRSRDFPEQSRQMVVQKLQAAKLPEQWQQPLLVVEADSADSQQAFGEALPAGLQLYR